MSSALFTNITNNFRRSINWQRTLWNAHRYLTSTTDSVKCAEGGDTKRKLVKLIVRMINVIFIDKDNKRTSVQAETGQSVLHAAQKNGIPIEGACDSSLACCTCHVYIQEKFFVGLAAPVKEEEDMLDMAPFLKANSRLGCQIMLTPEMDGIEIGLPPATRNFYIDGKVPDPH